jgi:hypothetical protein
MIPFIGIVIGMFAINIRNSVMSNVITGFLGLVN